MRLTVLLMTLLLAPAAWCDETAQPRPRLAEDDKSMVMVVLPTSAGPLTKLACTDLTRCLAKAIGAEVAIVGELSEVKTPLSILVGEGFGVDFGVSTDDLQRDGCVIRTRGPSVLIAGRHDAGIANGVYTFLMEQVGVRWFAPGELYEVVPTNPELTLPELDIKRSPDFGYRMFGGIVGDARAWERRNRLDVTTDNLPGYGFGHNLCNIFPPSRYGKDHPEYFALVGGVRQIPSDDASRQTQPCFTNPDVIRIAAEAADDYFRKNPTATTFSLCANDGAVFCRCPSCAALDDPVRKSKSGSDSYSDSYFHFVTEVAKIVEKTNPGKSLGVYAFWCTELPPRKVEKLPDSVVVELTQDTAQHFDPEYRAADRELYLAWSKVTKRLGKYDYYGLGWLTPRFYPHLAAADIKFLKDSGSAGLCVEAYPNWAVNAPQLYMASRLMWDASLDPDPLLDEYYKSLYGAAAPEIRKFYGTLEKYWAKPREGKWFFGLLNMGQELTIADDDLIEEAWQCLFRAKPLAIGPEAERIADLEEHFKLPYHIVRGYALSRRLREWEVKNSEDLAKLVSESFRALETVRMAGNAYDEVWAKDPLYQHVYYQGERLKGKLAAWEGEMKSGVKAAMGVIADYCEKELPEDQRDVVLIDLQYRLVSDETAQRFGIGTVDKLGTPD